MSAVSAVRVRAGDTEREATAERLREAHAEGRLRYDEFDTRLGAAYGATYLDELPALVADLPQPAVRGSHPARPPGRTGPRLAPVALVVLAFVLLALGLPPFLLFWVAGWLLFRHWGRGTCWRSGTRATDTV